MAKINKNALTKDEAEAYLEEISDFELDDEAIKNVAGGRGGSCRK